MPSDDADEVLRGRARKHRFHNRKTCSNGFVMFSENFIIYHTKRYKQCNMIVSSAKFLRVGQITKQGCIQEAIQIMLWSPITCGKKQLSLQQQLWAPETISLSFPCCSRRRETCLLRI